MNTIKLEHDSRSKSYSTSLRNEEHITRAQNDVSALFVEEVRHGFHVMTSFRPNTLIACFFFCLLLFPICEVAMIVPSVRPWWFSLR